jgi:hypothetical protein
MRGQTTIYNPTEFGAGSKQGRNFLVNIFNNYEEALKEFPDIAFENTWKEWTLDEAAIMQAYELARKEVYRYRGQVITPGILEFDPGKYYVSYGHIWFDQNVILRNAKEVVLVVDHKADAGKDPGLYTEDEAKAVISVGTDRHKKPGAAMWGFTTDLPKVELQYISNNVGLHQTTGAAYRFLSSYECRFYNIGFQGPFRYGIIFCAECEGTAYTHYHMSMCQGALIGIKWRFRKWMNSCYIHEGLWSGCSPQMMGYKGAKHGYDQSINPTILLDADNTQSNPNDGHYEWEGDYQGKLGGGGHWQFIDCGFENRKFQTFWRACAPRAHKFFRIRFESMGRSSMDDVLNNAIRRDAIILTKDPKQGDYLGSQNEFLDNYDMKHFPRIPKEYFEDGVIAVRGLDTFAGGRGVYDSVTHHTNDLFIDRDGGNILMKSDDGQATLKIFPVKKDGKWTLDVEEIASINDILVRSEGTDKWYGSDELLTVEQGTGIEFKIDGKNMDIDPYIWIGVYNYASETRNSVHESEGGLQAKDFNWETQETLIPKPMNNLGLHYFAMATYDKADDFDKDEYLQYWGRINVVKKSFKLEYEQAYTQAEIDEHIAPLIDSGYYVSELLVGDEYITSPVWIINCPETDERFWMHIASHSPTSLYFVIDAKISPPEKNYLLPKPATSITSTKFGKKHK